MRRLEDPAAHYVELYPEQHKHVLDRCLLGIKSGLQWVSLADIERFAGRRPAAGAVMALREQGKLQTRINRHGRVEIAAMGAGDE